MDVELEHGLHDLATNVTGDDPVTTGKIARAHLNEFPDYYARLEQMEEQAKRDLRLTSPSRLPRGARGDDVLARVQHHDPDAAPAGLTSTSGTAPSFALGVELDAEEAEPPADVARGRSPSPRRSPP